MKKICVYTCITGNYDDLHEISKKEKNVDYLCFTNNKNLKSNTWKIIHIEDDKLDNQRLSRKIKMVGHPIISENYDISVWIDASVVFKKSIIDFVNKYLKKNSFASFKHSYRTCIYEEAYECIKRKKDKKEVILEHVKFLEKENYPRNNGLYEMTVFIKKHNDPIVIKTMQLWFETICKHSKRDQLSFMYCVWKTGMKIDDINLSVWNNEWFDNVKHNSKQIISDYRIYYGKDDANFDIELDSQEEYSVKENCYSFTEKVLADTNVIEIHLSDVPCVKYSNLKITNLEFSKINIYNTISIDDDNIFYNDSGIVQLIGNFKKGQKFSLSIDFHILSDIEKLKMIENLSIKNIENSIKIGELELVKNEVISIKNSKSWKITKPLRKITNLLKRK